MNGNKPKLISRFTPGSKRILTTKGANEIVDRLNSLLTIRITRGDSDKVWISDANVIIQLKS